MRRMWRWVAALGVGLAVHGPAPAQDGARAQQLITQVEGRAQSFTPDARVPASPAALFRGELADVRGALDELIRLGEPAVPALARLLRHPSAHLRANAAWALGRVGGPRTVGALLTAVKDPSAAVRYQLAEALGYSASAAALPALNALSGDEQAAVRNMAIQASGALHEILTAEEAATPDQRIQALVELVYAPAAGARLASAYGAEAVPQLIAALDSPDRGMVAGAGATLAQIGDPRGLEPLWTHFQASVQKNAPETKFAQFIADYRSAEVWPYLQRLLDSGVPVAAYYALERLRTFEHPQRLSVIHAFLQKAVDAGQHKEVIRGPETEVSPVAAACVTLTAVGDRSSLELLNRIITEAPPAEKSIVKPLAERAKAAIEQRAG